MEKQKAKFLLPDGQAVERTVTSVLKQIGPTCMGSWYHTIQYKGQKYSVEKYSGKRGVKYELKRHRLIKCSAFNIDRSTLERLLENLLTKCGATRRKKHLFFPLFFAMVKVAYF